MAALTKDRNTARRSGSILRLGVAAAAVCYMGAIACRDANGYATPGATATTLKARGIFTEQVDNSAGANGDVSVDIQPGIYRFDNSSAGDLITIADIGNDCYIVDDQTVAKTDGAGTRSVAGEIIDVDSDGVWVKLG